MRTVGPNRCVRDTVFTWDERTIGRVFLNPEILPLSGRDLTDVVQWLRDVADDIQDGNWQTYLFPLERT